MFSSFLRLTSNVAGAPFFGAPENVLGRLGNLGRLGREPYTPYTPRKHFGLGRFVCRARKLLILAINYLLNIALPASIHSTNAGTSRL